MSQAVNGDFTEIPIVDMAPWRGDDDQRAAFADDVRDICHNVGFMVLTGHGVDHVGWARRNSFSVHANLDNVAATIAVNQPTPIGAVNFD